MFRQMMPLRKVKHRTQLRANWSGLPADIMGIYKFLAMEELSESTLCC